MLYCCADKGTASPATAAKATARLNRNLIMENPPLRLVGRMVSSPQLIFTNFAPDFHQAIP
jgi:hypothetical protein